ncbi:hypothetical protein BJ973_009617 [Actinoplanes tereljensis]|uniref:Uncharacterized protein n=1 Tax=Paractinoplanes tereljensis TaxID=571912 RepID=A0A919TQH1_9ACTN|nr:hypothetical protein [Actinoplanes tereljensis]GIF17420.1 hypothetical protein Ate02nite_01500 [Actinoplanes tereljensis]
MWRSSPGTWRTRATDEEPNAAWLDGWAWSDGSKEVSGPHVYGIELMRVFSELRAMKPGTPPIGKREGGLPWVAFTTHTHPQLCHYVCWSDWTGDRDILGTLYLRLVATRPVGYEPLARYAHQAWRRYRAGKDIPAPDFAGAGPVVDRDTVGWAASVAALTLNAKVRIVPTEPSLFDPLTVARMFDAVAGLLPARAAAALNLCMGMRAEANGPYRIAVGPDAVSDAVVVRPGIEPDLAAWPEAQAYRARLGRVLEQHPIAHVVRHLADAWGIPADSGAAIGALEEMDTTGG